MHRLYESGGIATPPSVPGSPTGPYPTSGSPGSVPATLPGPYWFHMLTEEIYNVIIAAGLTPAHGTLTQLRDAIPLLTVKPAMIAYFAFSGTPTGWLKCNGAAVSRTTYANLFFQISTNYGAGDGSTTFNLPDLRGEFIRGWDDSRGVDPGRLFSTFQSDSLKSHSHDGENAARDAGVTTSMVQNGTGGTFAANVVAAFGGTETRPRNIALNACIKY